MQSYKAARSYFSVAGFVAKGAISLGILIALIAASAVSKSGIGVMAISAAPGIILAMLGNFILVNIQTARATVDSAEYAQQSLKLSRDQFELSKQMLALAQPASSPSGYAAETASNDLPNVSFDTEAPTKIADQEAPQPQLGIEEYRGKQIEKTAEGYRLENDTFTSLENAQKAIDFPEARNYLAVRQAAS